MRRHCVWSPYTFSAIEPSVSPDATSYVSPAAVDVSGTGDAVAALATAADGDGPGEANWGRDGLGAAAGLADTGTTVGVGPPAPLALHATPSQSVKAAQVGSAACLLKMRRELRS